MAALALPGSPALAAGPAPYGLHDAGGFRNILPAGENGTDNAAQLAAFLGTGAYDWKGTTRGRTSPTGCRGPATRTLSTSD